MGLARPQYSVLILDCPQPEAGGEGFAEDPREDLRGGRREAEHLAGRAQECGVLGVEGVVQGRSFDSDVLNVGVAFHSELQGELQWLNLEKERLD